MLGLEMVGTGRMVRLLVVVAVGLVMCDAVVGQCSDQGVDKPVKYVGYQEACEESSDDETYIVLCKNFLPCRLSNVSGTRSCMADTSDSDLADYPFSDYCFSDEDCYTPQKCIESMCDYVDLPNGYACEEDTQCASNFCNFPSEGVVWGTCEVRLGGLGRCNVDSDCEKGYFCNDNNCTASLPAGEDCTEYSGLSQTFVCEPGYVCLPLNETVSTCAMYYSKKLGEYCGDSPRSLAYSCGADVYCNPDMNFTCTGWPSLQGDEACNTTDIDACPEGYACNCLGVETEPDQMSKCAKFYNYACSRSVGKYTSCLHSAGCPFDPFTLVNNPDGPFAPVFIGPLSRYSCAAMNCMKEYDSIVKCQGDGIDKSNTFSPAFVPKWASYYDAVLKGWQLAIIVVCTGVAIVLVVTAVIVISNRAKRSEYETIDD